MSEEEKKEKQKPKVISSIPRLAGFVPFLSGLLVVFFTCWLAFGPHDKQLRELNVIVHIFFTVCLVSFELFWHITAISLIVLLFIERDMRRRVLPLAFVLAGILLYAACYAYLWFATDWLRIPMFLYLSSTNT